MVKEREYNQEGDVVLIYYKDEPSVYARIESIEPDVKKDWYQVTLLMLTLPPQVTTWILREEYINGTPYTMGGEPLRIERVKKVERDSPDRDNHIDKPPKEKKEAPKVIPLRRETP
jgi:hypothetical protein